MAAPHWGSKRRQACARERHQLTVGAAHGVVCAGQAHDEGGLRSAKLALRGVHGRGEGAMHLTPAFPLDDQIVGHAFSFGETDGSATTIDVDVAAQ
jgi:hypothetical protein